MPGESLDDMGSVLDEPRRLGTTSQSHESFLRRLSQLARSSLNTPQENEEIDSQWVLSSPPAGFDDAPQAEYVTSIHAADSKVSGSASRVTPPPNFQDAEEPEGFVPACCCPPEVSTGPLRPCCEEETGGCFRSPHAALLAQAAAFAHLTAPPAPCTCCAGDIDALKRTVPITLLLEQPAPSEEEKVRKNWGSTEEGAPQTCGCSGADVPQQTENKEICPCKRDKMAVWTENLENTRAPDNEEDADITKWVILPPPTIPSLRELPPEPNPSLFVYQPATGTVAGLPVTSNTEMKDTTPQASNTSFVLERLRKGPRRSEKADAFMVTNPASELELPPQPVRPHGDGRRCLEKAGVEGRLVPLECVDPVKCKEDCVRATVPVTFELPDVPVTSYLMIDKSICSADNLITPSGCSGLSSEKLPSGSDSYLDFVETTKSVVSSKFDPLEAKEPVSSPGIQASMTQGNVLPEIVLPESKPKDDLLVEMGPSSSGIDIPKQASDYPLDDLIIPPPPAEFSSTLPTTNIDDDSKLKKTSSSDSVIVNVCAIGFTFDNGNRFSVALSDSDEKILFDSRKEETSNTLDKFIKYSSPTETRGMLNFVEPDAIELEYMDYIKRKICGRKEISEDREYIEEQDVDMEVDQHVRKLQTGFNSKLRQIEYFDLVSNFEKNELNNIDKFPSGEKNSTEINFNEKSDLIGLMECIPVENKEICGADLLESNSLNLMPPPPEYEDTRIKSSITVEKESENKISSSNSINLEKQMTERTTSNTLDEWSNERTLRSTLSPKVYIAGSECTVVHCKADLNKITTGTQVSLGEMRLSDVNNNFFGFQKTRKVDIGTSPCCHEKVTEKRIVSCENVTHFSNFNEQYERGNQFITDGADYHDGGKEDNIALKSPEGVSTPPSRAEWIPTQGTPEIIHSRTILELFIECDYEKSETEVNHAQFLSGLSDSSSEAVDFEEVPVGETREVEIPAIMDGRKIEQSPTTYNEMKDCTEQASTQNVENSACLSEKTITQGVDAEEKNSYDISPLYQKVKYKRTRKSSKSNSTELLDTEEYIIDISTSSFREVSDAKKIKTLYMTGENSFLENDTSLTLSDFGSFEQSNSSHSCCSENSSIYIPLTSRGMNTSLGNSVASDNHDSDRVPRVNMSEEKNTILDHSLTELNESVSDSQHLRFSGLNDVRLNVFVPQTNDEMKANENCNEKYHDCYDFDGLDTLVELNDLYQLSLKKYITDRNSLCSKVSKQSLQSDTLDEKCDDSFLQMSCNISESDRACLHEHIEKCPILQLPGCSKILTPESSVFHNVSEILGKVANEAPKVFTLDYWPQRFQDMVHCTQGAKQKIGDLMKFVALYGLIQRHPYFQNYQLFQPLASPFSTFHKASTNLFSSAGTLLKEAITYSSKIEKDHSQSELVKKYGKCEPAFVIKSDRKEFDVFECTANGHSEKEEERGAFDANSNAQLSNLERKNIAGFTDHHLMNPIDITDDDATYLFTSAVQLYTLEKEESHILPTDGYDVRHIRQNESDSVSESTSVSYFSASDVLVTRAYVDDLSLDGRRVVFQVNNDKEGRTFPSPAILRKHMMVSHDDDSDTTGKTLDDITIDTEMSAFSTKDYLRSADTRWNKHSKVIPPDKLKDIALQLLKKYLERKATEPTSLLEREIGSNITHMKILKVHSSSIKEGVLEPSQEVIETSTDNISETDEVINLDSFIEEITEWGGPEENKIGISDETEKTPEEILEITTVTEKPSLGSSVCLPKKSLDVIVTSKSTLSNKKTCSSLTTDQCTDNESTCTIVHALLRDMESVKQATNDKDEMTLDNVEDENPLTLELSNINNENSPVVFEDSPISEALLNLLKEKTMNREYLQAFSKEIEHSTSHDYPRVANEDTIKLVPFIAMETDSNSFNTLAKEITETLETSQEVSNKNTTNFQRNQNLNNLIRFSTYNVLSSENLEVHSNTDFITSHTSEECSTGIHLGVSKNMTGIVGSPLDSTDKLSSFVQNNLHKFNEKSLKSVNRPDAVFNKDTRSSSPTTVIKSEQRITARGNEAECGELARIEKVLCGKREREEGKSDETEPEMKLEAKCNETEHEESLREDNENEVDHRGDREHEVEQREEENDDANENEAKNDKILKDTTVEFVVAECQEICLFGAISEEEQQQLEEAERLQLDAEQLKTNAERLKSEAARLKSDTERLQSNLERLQVETPRQNTKERELTKIMGATLEDQRRHDAAVTAALGGSNNDKSTSERSCSELDAVTSQLRADLQDVRQRLARKSHEMKMMHQQLVVTEVGGRANSTVPHENLPVDCYTMLNTLLSLLSSISITVEESSEIALANLPPPPPPPPPLLLSEDHVTTETVHSSSPTDEETKRGSSRLSSFATDAVDEGSSTHILDVVRDREDRSLFEELLSVFASHKPSDSNVVKKSKSQPILRQSTLRQRNVEFTETLEQKKSNRQKRKVAQGEFLRRRSISEVERPSRRREFEERLSPWEELADKNKELLIPGTIDWNPRRLSTVYEEDNVEESIPNQEEQKSDRLKSHQQTVSKQQQKCVSEAAGDTSIHIAKENIYENCSSVKKYETQQNKMPTKAVTDESDGVSRTVSVTVKHNKTALTQWATRSDNFSDCIHLMPNVDNENWHESIICRKLGGYGETIPFLKRARKNVMLSCPVIVPIFDEVVVETTEPLLHPIYETKNASEKRQLNSHQTKSDEEIELSKRHREEYGCCTSNKQHEENGSKISWLPHTCYKMFTSLCNVSSLSKYFTDNKENESSWGQTQEVSSTSLPAAPRWLSTSEIHAPSSARCGKTVSRSRRVKSVSRCSRKKRRTHNRSTSSTSMAGCDAVGKVISQLPAELRPLDAQSLLLRWPVVKHAQGYEIFVNGELKQKVYSGTRDQAALLDLNMSKQVQVTVLPRMSPGYETPLFYACATFTPSAEVAH